MKLPVFSRSELRTLASNGSWALKLIFSTNPYLSVGLFASSLARGVVPAGLALFARGIINVFVSDGGVAAVRIEDVLSWVLFGFGVTMLEAIAPLTTRFCTERLNDELNLKITGDILRHSESLEPAFFEDSDKRNLIDLAQDNPAGPLMQFVMETQLAATSLLQIVLLTAVLIVIEPLVLVAMPPFALPYLIFQWRLSKRRYEEKYHRIPQWRWTRYFVSLLTGRHSLAEVRILNLSPYLRRKFQELMMHFKERDRRIYRRSFVGSSLFALGTTVGFYLIFLKVIVNVINGVLTVGDVAVFGVATARLRFSLESAIRSIAAALEQTLYHSNLMKYFAHRPQETSSNTMLQSPCRGEIQLKNVSFTYPGSAEPVLNDISILVTPGETVALVGENGAGKTTLVKIMARLYDPDTGTVEFDGVNVKTISRTDLHKHIGFVFQEFNRYEATAGDNIAYGDWQGLLNNTDKIEEVSRLAGIDPMIRAMPDGYRTMLGRMFGQHDLSNGQWQKLAIARAFARDASLLILDEPASSLSAQAEYELFCRFHKLSRGRTTILVSHRFSTLSIADRIVVLEKGRIVECGTHQELLTKGNLYAKLYHLHHHPLRAMKVR